MTSVVSSTSLPTGALRSLTGSMIRGTAPRSFAEVARAGAAAGFEPPGLGGNGMLGIRGNGPAMLSTGAGVCAAAAPGMIGIERVCCDGAVLPATGTERVPCEAVAGLADGFDGTERVPSEGVATLGGDGTDRVPSDGVAALGTNGIARTPCGGVAVRSDGSARVPCDGAPGTAPAGRAF
jgi:hypothetical protein